MVYLEYSVLTKQVIEIHETIPELQDGYNYAISDDFNVGDEFEQTIWVNEVDDNKKVVSYSAVRNNPQAKRLLEENNNLKQMVNELETALLEMTTISAEQEQAILELSTLLAGGNE